MARGTYFLGLILFVALTARGGKAESTFFDDVENQIAADSENSLSLSLPATQGQQVERRLSLEDFFLNRNNQQDQQQQQQQAVEQQVQQLPAPQFQVQQQDPNSVLLVRDSQFPSANGGLISRLLMARRMFRLRRWARRLRFIPQLLGLGSQQPIRQASEHQPVVLLNSRVGRSYDDNYDPRDYVFGNKGHSYNTSLRNQEKSYEREYEKPRKNDYSSETKPYYDTVNDLPYNLYEHSNVKPAKNYETEDVIVPNQNHQNQALNLIDTGSHANNQQQTHGIAQDIQQQLLYLQSLQQKLPLLVNQQNNQNENYNQQQQTHTGQIQNHNTQSEQYNQNSEIYNNNQQEAQQANRYNQNKEPLVDSNHYEQLQDNNKYQQNPPIRDQSHQANLDQQLQLLREQQYQLAREQQFQLARDQQLKQLQQLQLLQQAQNYNQPQLQTQNYNQPQQQNHQNYNQPQQQNHQNYNQPQQQNHQNYNQPQQNHNQQSNVVSNEQLYNYQQQSYQQVQNPQLETQQIQGDRTENSGYERPLLKVGATNLQSGTRAGSSGNSIGVGVNVGLLPPAIDISVSKPTVSGIKPLPPIINPIGPKPIPVQPVQEQLVPLGFLPKPILNLNGRLFFGAELGKGVNLGR